MMQAIEELSSTIDAALGQKPLDLVIMGGNLVNVFTGEVYPADIGVWNGMIVAVGDVGHVAMDDRTQRLDWSGRYVLPGLFDPHFHIGGSQLCIPSLARLLLQHGTTSIATDLQEIYAYSGAQGVRYVIDEARRTGLRLFYLPPVHMFGIEKQGHFRHGLDADEMETMLDWAEAVGINEPPPEQVLGKNPDVLQLIVAASQRHKIFPGHLPETHGRELQAYAATGASSDHESTVHEDALEKLRLGLWTMMRQGSAAPDMQALLPLFDQVPAATRFGMVCSDEQDANDISTNGNVDEKIRMAIRHGMDPVPAIQLGTINPATYFRIADQIGSVTPGRQADLVAVTDLHAIDVTDVVSHGKLVVRGGALVEDYVEPHYPDTLQSEVRWPRNLGAEDFTIAAPGESARVRVIGVKDGSLVSERLEATLPVENGNVRPDPSADILKMAVIDRHSGSMDMGRGFVSGLGIKDGALATTYCHVHYNALVIGTSEEQMAIAAGALANLGGGFIVVDGNEVVVRWPLPLVGVFSTRAPEEAVGNVAAANAALQMNGCRLSSPILGLSFVALTTIPSYGMTERGLYDVEKKQFVDVIIGQ